MTPIIAEVLEAAMALSPEERLDLADRLLRSVGTDEADRIATLREDVALGFEQIDRGEGIEVPRDELREYVRELGHEAALRVAQRSA